jgi:hypothetical protein
MAAKRVLFLTVLLLSGCGLCDRYCDRRDRCQNYNHCQPTCTPTPAPAYYGNGCQPAGVVPTANYPQPAYNPYCQ